MVVQVDGKILVGGSFPTLSGQPSSNVARLNGDGTLDTNFNSGASGGVISLALQADGKIVAAGTFTNLAGAARTYLGRLDRDDTVDPAFNPLPTGGLSSSPYLPPHLSSIDLQADGKTLVGGRFTTLAGQTRTNIGRLVNTYPATQSLGFDGSTVTWLRVGTSPEVGRTRFDASTNGIDWISLAPVTRISGGWRVSGG